MLLVSCFLGVGAARAQNLAGGTYEVFTVNGTKLGELSIPKPPAANNNITFADLGTNVLTGTLRKQGTSWLYAIRPGSSGRPAYDPCRKRWEWADTGLNGASGYIKLKQPPAS